MPKSGPSLPLHQVRKELARVSQPCGDTDLVIDPQAFKIREVRKDPESGHSEILLNVVQGIPRQLNLDEMPFLNQAPAKLFV